MRAAGDAIARLIDRYARGDGAVVGIAGAGNNGGDAYAALAAYDGTRRRVIFADASASVRHDGAARRDARERARVAGVEERPFPPDAATLRYAGLVLDGVLGANARLPLDARSAELVDAIAASGAPVLALDVPTGIDPTTGAAGAHVVHATATIALGRPKLGLSARRRPRRGRRAVVRADRDARRRRERHRRSAHRRAHAGGVRRAAARARGRVRQAQRRRAAHRRGLDAVSRRGGAVRVGRRARGRGLRHGRGTARRRGRAARAPRRASRRHVRRARSRRRGANDPRR